MSQGWEVDDRVAPHRVLRTSLGFNELHSLAEVGPAAVVTVAGRSTLVCAGLPTPDGSHYAAIDVETGARVPDRSGLHGAEGPQGLAVGMCGDRAVAALMTPHPEDGEPGDGSLRLRDLWSGELVDVHFPAMRVRSKIAVTTVDGRGIVAVESAVYDARDGSFIAEHRAPGFVLHAVHRGRLLLLCYDFRQRFFWFIDALTGDTVGEAFEVPLPYSRDRAKAAVEVDGHLWVFFVTGRYGADPLMAWDVTVGHAVSLPALWDAEAAAEWPIEDVDVMCRNGEISVLVQWGYHGRHGTELWVPAAHGRRLAVQFGESTALAIGVLDGRPAAVAADEGRALRVFDLAADAMVASPYYNGRVVARELRIRAASFADIDGRGSALRCGGTGGVVWDVESGLPAGKPFSGGPVRNIAAGLLDGQAVFAVLTGRNTRSAVALQVWDPQTAETFFFRELPPDTDSPFAECPLTFVEVGGLHTVAVRCDRHIEFLDARSGETVGRIEAAGMGIISALATGRLGGRTVLAAGDGYGAVRVFDPATGQEMTPTLGAHDVPDRSSGHANAWVLTIAFARITGRDVVIAGGTDHLIRMWDAATGEAVGAPLSGHTGEITALLPTRWAGEAALISVASRGAPRLWMLEASPVDTGHTGAVTALAAGTRNGQPVFASGSEDATIRLWDAAGLIAASIDAGGAVTAVAFGGPGRDILVGVTDDGLVQRWDANSGAKLGDPLHHGGHPMYAAATVDVDGRYLLGVSGADETLRIWDLVTGEPLTRVPVGQTVRSLSLAATGGRLLAMVHGEVVGDAHYLAESMATLWDVWAAEPVRKPLQLGDGAEVAVLGVRDGRAVLVQGLDVGDDDFGFDPAGMDDLQVRDAVTGELLHEFDDHRYGRCSAVATVTAAERVWIVSGHEGGVVLLDDEFRQVGEVYDGHKSSAVACVAVTESAGGGLVIASSDRANSVHIWPATIPS